MNPHERLEEPRVGERLGLGAELADLERAVECVTQLGLALGWYSGQHLRDAASLERGARRSHHGTVQRITVREDRPRRTDLADIGRSLVCGVVFNESQGGFKFANASLPDEAKVQLDKLMVDVSANPRRH